MHTKDFKAAVKAAGEADGLVEGQFVAVVSVFGNEDSMGDVVMPGAFKADLDRWAAKGDPLPVIWSHDWSDPFSHLGRVLSAEETETGLQVTAQIDDLDSNPKAAQVYRLLKGRRVTQFSFAYDIVDGAWGERGDREVYELRELKVHEVGPCLLGANQETQLLASKARRIAVAAKSGQTLSAQTVAALQSARDSLDEVLVDAQKTTAPNPGAAKTDEPSQVDEPGANGEEPARANPEERPAKSAPRRALAVARITNLTS